MISNEDAIKLVSIMCSADGGCSHCATKLLEELVRGWPDVRWHEVLAHIQEEAAEAKKEGRPTWGATDAAEWLEDTLKGLGH